MVGSSRMARIGSGGQGILGKKAELLLAYTLLGVCVVGWPTSALTVARDEPQFILGLSWFALILTALDLIKTSKVHKDQ